MMVLRGRQDSRAPFKKGPNRLDSVTIAPMPVVIIDRMGSRASVLSVRTAGSSVNAIEVLGKRPISSPNKNANSRGMTRYSDSHGVRQPHSSRGTINLLRHEKTGMGSRYIGLDSGGLWHEDSVLSL